MILMNGMINDKPKETRRLQQSAVEITRLSPEYSRRSKTETHKNLERFWNQIQKLEKQLKEEA